MDETTLFQNQNLQKPEVLEKPETPEPQIQTPPQDNSFQSSKDSSSVSFGFSSRFKIIAKLFLGIFVVFLFTFLIFGLILPSFNKGNQKVTLSYWGLLEDSKIMQSVISDFEKENPNISINYSKEDIKQYRERLSTRIKNGTGPDIFSFHNTWIPMLLDILLPLPTDVITKDEFTKSFYPVIQKDLIRSGAIYGVPLQIDTLNLYINSDLFQNAGLTPPTNWNDFVNDAKSLTVKDENDKIQTAGAAMGTFDNIAYAPDIISLLFVQNGVDLSDLSLSSGRVSDALTFYTAFANVGNNIWDSTLDNSTLAFSKGNLAMYFGYSSDFFTIKSENPQLNFQIVPVPQLPNGDMTIASYWVEGASIKSTHQEETLLFMKFLSKKETQKKLYTEESKSRLFGEPYSRIDLADTLKDSPYAYPFVNAAGSAVSSYFVDLTYDNGLNFQMNTYLRNAVNSILQNTSPESASETLSQGVFQVLQQYGQ